MNTLFDHTRTIGANARIAATIGTNQALKESYLGNSPKAFSLKVREEQFKRVWANKRPTIPIFSSTKVGFERRTPPPTGRGPSRGICGNSRRATASRPACNRQQAFPSIMVQKNI